MAEIGVSFFRSLDPFVTPGSANSRTDDASEKGLWHRIGTHRLTQKA